MAVAGSRKRWNPWGGRGPLGCRCIGGDTDSPFVRCNEAVDYERKLVELLVRMHEKAEGFANKPHLNYFVVSWQSERVWFFNSHEYWACDWDFEMRRRAIR